MSSMTVETITGALIAAQDAQDRDGWGDEEVSLFAVVDGPEGCGFLALASIETDIEEGVDALIEAGCGLASEPGIVGVVACSEAWRALHDDELREALKTAETASAISDAAEWHQICELFRARTDLSELPDRFRRELRVAACLTRDGTFVQAVRDRGQSTSHIDVFVRDEGTDRGRVAHALRRLLTAPGLVRLP